MSNLNFEDICSHGICDCCNSETNVVVCGSACGPISYAYCERCLNEGYEPYSGLVAYIASSINMDQEEDYKNNISDELLDIIKRNLEFYNKTEEQFISDMKVANKSYYEYCNRTTCSSPYVD